MDPQNFLAPSHGTNGMYCSQYLKRWACPPGAPFQRLLLPMDTSIQGFRHAVAGKGWSAPLDGCSYLVPFFMNEIVYMYYIQIYVIVSKKISRDIENFPYISCILCYLYQVIPF